MNNYKKIVSDLINKSFPELKKEKIKIIELKGRIFWFLGGFTVRGIKKDFILINSKLQKLRILELKGVLAHELCHVVDLRGKNFIHYWILIIPYLLNKVFGGSLIRKIENKTDKETIKRGYAKELYSFGKSMEKRYSKKVLSKSYSKGYLSPKEIKSYAQKIGKW